MNALAKLSSRSRLNPQQLVYLAKPFQMKQLPFYLLVLCTLFSLNSCSDNNSDPEPEKIQKSGFKGCRLIKILRTNNGRNPADDSYVEYTYDDNNNIVKEAYYYTNGTLIDFETYEYDALGKITSSKTYDSTGVNALPHRRTDYLYNSSGMLYLKKQFSLNTTTGNFIFDSERKYTYDSGGRVDSSWEAYDLNGTTRIPWIYTFVYDTKGNLIKELGSSVLPNGVVDPPIILNEYLSYDNFKNPKTQKNFTLRQIRPISFFTGNNCTKDFYSAQYNRNYAYTYRPDSLVTERKYIEANTSEIYFYECR